MTEDDGRVFRSASTSFLLSLPLLVLFSFIPLPTDIHTERLSPIIGKRVSLPLATPLSLDR
jgi:hypothetical protein